MKFGSKLIALLLLTQWWRQRFMRLTQPTLTFIIIIIMLSRHFPYNISLFFKLNLIFWTFFSQLLTKIVIKLNSYRWTPKWFERLILMFGYDGWWIKLHIEVPKITCHCCPNFWVDCCLPWIGLMNSKAWPVSWLKSVNLNNRLQGVV